MEKKNGNLRKKRELDSKKKEGLYKNPTRAFLGIHQDMPHGSQN